MKKTVTPFPLLLFILLCSLPLKAQFPHLIFHAELGGNELAPPVNTPGKGLVTFLYTPDRTKITVSGMLVRLQGTVTYAKIHFGKTGQTGAVALDLLPLIDGRRIEGQLDAPPALLPSLLVDSVYAEVHTTANPGGEIRGQFVCETDLDYGVSMSGNQVVPTSASSAVAFGAIHFPLGSGDVVYAFTMRGLSSQIKHVGIYEGQPGENGTLKISLPNPLGSTFMQALILLDTVDPDFLRKAREGKYYMMIKTVNFPDGEVRGQIQHFGYFESIAPINGLQVVPSPGPTVGFGFSHNQLSPALDKLTSTVFINNINPTSVKIHVGNPGENGPVLVDMDPMITPGFYTKTIPLTEALLTDFAQGRIYIQATTTAHPNGEIRGFMKNTLRKGYAFDMCGIQVVPPNTSHALGIAVASVDQSNCYLNYKIIADGLTGAPSSGNIFDGEFGVDGTALFDLATTQPIIPGSHEIMLDFGPVIEDGGAYMEINTPGFPNGEIRGQIRRGLTCPDLSGTSSPDMIKNVEVGPVPFNGELFLNIESQENFEGRVVLYDMLGSIALMENVSVLQGMHTFQFNTQTLPSGTYAVSIEIPSHQTSRFVQKVVKR